MRSCFAWRLVHPMLSFGAASLTPRSVPGKYHQAGDRVLYGWSSSEVAFMSMHEIAGAHAPRQLLREKIRLPIYSNQILTITDCVSVGMMSASDVSAPRSLVALMRRHELLGVWAESAVQAGEYVLVLNGSHPDVERVGVVRSQMLTRGMHY